MLYYIDRFAESDDFKTLLGSFQAVFTSFVGGPDDTIDLLDVFFGILSTIILLNVVIAIVSDAWADSTQNATEVFWQYRLDFILEVANAQRPLGRRNHLVETKESAATKSFVKRDAHIPSQSPDQDDGLRDEARRVDFTGNVSSAVLPKRQTEIRIETPTRIQDAPDTTTSEIKREVQEKKENLDLLNLLIFCGDEEARDFFCDLERQDEKLSDIPEGSKQMKYYSLWNGLFLLGLVTCGYTWPLRVRMDLFGGNKVVRGTAFSSGGQAASQSIPSNGKKRIQNLERQLVQMQEDLKDTREQAGESMKLLREELSSCHSQIQHSNRKLEEIATMIKQLGDYR